MKKLLLSMLLACPLLLNGAEDVRPLRQEAASLRNQSRTKEAIALYGSILGKDISKKDRMDTLMDIASLYNHALQDRAKAKPYYLELIGLMKEDIKDAPFASSRPVLGRIEHIYRMQLRMRKEAEEISAQIADGIFSEINSSGAKGLKLLELRTDAIKNMRLAGSRFKAEDIDKSEKETRDAAIAFVKEKSPLPYEEWLKETGNPASLMNILSSSEEGKRVALEMIADRIFDPSANRPGDEQRRRALMHTAANIAKSAKDRNLNKKAATYYRLCGNFLMEGAAHFWSSRDINAAREAFRRAPPSLEATNNLAMLSDEPTISWQLEYARAELENWVRKITGKNLEEKYVLGTPATSPEIDSFAKRHKEDFARLEGNDGFIIAKEKGVNYIAASKTKGVLNGVYRLLEKNSDIIWVRELEGEDGFGTVYGKMDSFVNNIGYLVDVPRLTSRDWTGVGFKQRQYQARLLNTWTLPFDGNLTPAKFREVSTIGDMSSMSANLGLGLVMKHKDTDPDIFPLVDGKRVSYHDCQLCFMNPKTVRLFSEEAKNILRGMPKTVKNISIGLGDNWEVCNCPEFCLKPIVLEDGSELAPEAANFRATQYAIFVNSVYKEIAKEFPHINPPGAAAYLFTAFPSAVKYLGGGGCYCPYIKNHKKPVYDRSVNETWAQRIEDFNKAGMPFRSLYEYYLCSSTPQFYHATMEVMQKDLLHYGKDLKGCYLDVVYHDSNCSHERNDNGGAYDASAIEFWVASRLMWNPDEDVKALRREFCRRAYREAGEIMAGYYERLADGYNSDSAGCFWNDDPVSAAKHYIVEKGLASWLRETLRKAEDAAKHPSSKELIRRHRLHMEALVAKAEKAPKKVEVSVPLIPGEPDGTDFRSPFWSKAAALEPITAIQNANIKKDTCKMLARHDGKSLHLLVSFKDARALEMYREYEKAGKLSQGPVGKNENFNWCACIELFMDAGLKSAGSYYHLGISYDGKTHTGQGPTPLEDAPAWTAKVEPAEEGLAISISLPLLPFGVEISKGNKIGAMILAGGTAWNGGQWHSPTGFQTLALEMQ